jgi:hypothetical protein
MNSIEEIEISVSQTTLQRADWSFLDASSGAAGIGALLRK